MTHDRLLRWRPLPLLLALCFSLPSASSGQSPSRRNPGRFWSSDYRSALATAQRQSKPIMLVFRCVP